MAGLVMVGSLPNMAYFGAGAAGVSTGAIAIAVPGGAHAPLMLDMASAVASIGKLVHARDAGQTLPPGPLTLPLPRPVFLWISKISPPRMTNTSVARSLPCQVFQSRSPSCLKLGCLKTDCFTMDCFTTVGFRLHFRR